MFAFSPMPHADAVKRIAGLPVVSREVMDGLLPELRAYAFTVTGLDGFDQLSKVKDMIKAVPAGEQTWDKARKQIAAELTDDLGGKVAQRRAELLLRTHVFRGYAASRYRNLMQQVDVFPYWQYRTHGDGRVRPSHAALNGKIFPAGHEIWQRIFPPWDWGCRCIVVPLTQNGAADIIQRGRPGAQKAADSNLLQTQIVRPEMFTAKEASLIDKNQRLPDGIPLNRTPTWADSPWSKPGTVKHDYKAIAKRYAHDPDTLKAWEEWANQAQITDKMTVAQWVGLGPKKSRLKKKTAAAPAQPADASAKLNFPDSPDGLKVVKKLGGSTGAVLVEDANGTRFVMKKGASAEHLREEVLADEIYRGLGAHVPEPKLYETKAGPVKLARFIEGETLADYLKKATPAQREAVFARLGEHFHADVLMGNWDVVGLAKDNILVDTTGVPWRIDNGGSLRFRAMGGEKGADWNAYPDELWSLRNAAKNAQTAEVFGGLKLTDVAKRVEATSIAGINAPAEIKAVLDERWKHISDISTKALDMQHDGWRDGYGESLCRHILGLRKAGISADLPKELKQAAGSVSVVDENGKPWDGLRKDKTAVKAAPAQTDAYWNDMLNAAKTLNHHSGTGGFAYNKTKVAAALAHKTALEKLAQGKGAKAAMGQHYLNQLTQIEAAAKAMDQKTKGALPNFTAWAPKPPPTPKPAPSNLSLMERLRDYMTANGGDFNAVTRWKDGQGKSSWHDDAQAKKAWVARHMDIPAKDVFWRHGVQHSANALKSMEGSLGAAKVDAAFTIQHALMQEFLAATDMRHNDRALRAMRLIRTENAAPLNTYGLKPGADGSMPRGLCESSSPFKVTDVHGKEAVIQAVPHSRILGTYLMEKTPGAGDCGFLYDAENEFTFAAGKMPFHYAGNINTVKVSTAAGNDAMQWGVPLQHLRSNSNPQTP
ncbi:phage minor head protein [Prosthecobacter sp.]|uniref:phage head morphogenesis protein n=1 Tax=Prosthecobacter sp. TaxID=1965333 RepID=UPI003783787F